MHCCYLVVKGKTPGEGELSQRQGSLQDALSFWLGGSWDRQQEEHQGGLDSAEKDRPSWRLWGRLKGGQEMGEY